ncbi:MAG: hypothetical protein ACF8MF_05025 [Phycisphaerales bacterium JB052]
MKPTYISILLILICARCVWAEDATALSALESSLSKLNTGISMLEQRDRNATLQLQEAAADLQRVIDEHHVTTPAAYHALGNAYSLIGDEGRAVLAYKRGERIAPTDPRLRDSLRQARAQVQIKVEPDTSHRVVSLLMSWRGVIPRSLLWGGALGLFTLAWLMLSARVGFSAPRWFIPFALWSLGASLLPLGALIAEWALYEHANEVVITQANIVARSGPDDSIYEPVYTEPLSPGVEGQLLETRDTWARLKLADGTECWVPQDAFESVFVSTLATAH